MIGEFDTVALTRAVEEHGLEADDIGTVVMVHGDGAGFEVEFVTLAGETVAVVTLPVGGVRELHPDEIAHARLVVV